MDIYDIAENPENISDGIGSISDIANASADISANNISGALAGAAANAAGIAAGVAGNLAQAGIGYVAGMIPEEVSNILGLASGIMGQAQDKIQELMGAIPGVGDYKPTDIFKQEDKEKGFGGCPDPSDIEAAEEAVEETAEEGDAEDEDEGLTKTQKLKKKFQEGMNNIIAGLDPDIILEKLAELCKPLQDAMKPILDSIYYIEQNKRISPEEKALRKAALKEQKKKQIEAWKNSQKEYVKHIINDIKADFDEIKFGVENLSTTIPIIASQLAMPTFIGTGSPNPARIAADFLAIKHMLMAMVHPLQTAARKLLDNCDRIGFDLPEPALGVLESITKVGDMINQLPG